MSKETDSGWPDPNDWAKRLHERLDAVGDDFVGASWKPPDDPTECSGLNLKQVLAGKAIMEVCLALQELPSFKKSTGVGALHTIAAALDDVVNGGQPQLFRAAIPGSPGRDGLQLRYVRGQVVLAVRFLVEGHNMSVLAASKVVAPTFANAGATGRTGKPLSITTVKDWCERTHPLAEKAYDVNLHNDVEARLSDLRRHPEWPGKYEDAKAWIARLASHPLLVSKYG